MLHLIDHGTFELVRPEGRIPYIILPLGFLWVKDAGRRGNKITASHLITNAFFAADCHPLSF